MSGLSVRTIQRIESGGAPGPASLTALAGAFGVEVEHFLAADEREASGERTVAREPEPAPTSFPAGIRTCLAKYADFEGRAGRAEYWWFLLFVVLAGAAATLVAEVLGAVVLLALLLPLLAAGARRLHDTGRSGWWQLLTLAPFGGVVPLIMLAQPSMPRPGPGGG